MLEIWRTVKQVRSDLTFLLMFPLLFPLFPLPLSSPAYLFKSRKKKRNTKLISNVFFLGAWMSYQVQILLSKIIFRRQGGVTKYKYRYKYKYCRSKAWMCDQDGVLQGKPMHRDDCHYIITVSSQIQIRISAISFVSSQLLPISNDCPFCFRYDCHHHQRSVGLLM